MHITLIIIIPIWLQPLPCSPTTLQPSLHLELLVMLVLKLDIKEHLSQVIIFQLWLLIKCNNVVLTTNLKVDHQLQVHNKHEILGGLALNKCHVVLPKPIIKPCVLVVHQWPLVKAHDQIKFHHHPDPVDQDQSQEVLNQCLKVWDLEGHLVEHHHLPSEHQTLDNNLLWAVINSILKLEIRHRSKWLLSLTCKSLKVLHNKTFNPQSMFKDKNHSQLPCLPMLQKQSKNKCWVNDSSHLFTTFTLSSLEKSLVCFWTLTILSYFICWNIMNHYELKLKKPSLSYKLTKPRSSLQ